MTNINCAHICGNSITTMLRRGVCRPVEYPSQPDNAIPIIIKKRLGAETEVFLSYRLSWQPAFCVKSRYPRRAQRKFQSFAIHVAITGVTDEG